jgi:Sec-independent protein translocase protein TatA
MAGEEGVCVGFVALVVILVILWVIFKIAKFLGYIGMHRTGKALKKIQKEGLLIRQEQQVQESTQAEYRPQTRQLKRNQQVAVGPSAGPKFCAYCGRPIGPGSFCQWCGERAR